MTRVVGLFVYPVKSCRAVAVSRAEVTRRGLSLDRRWMVVDEEGTFLTLRTERRLALVGCGISGGRLVLSAAGHGAIEVPATVAEGPRCEVTVWGYRASAISHAGASGWMSAVLGRPCRVVYMPEDVERPVSPKRGKPGDLVSFADAYPVLLTSTGSLDALNGRLPAAVPMARFRPNVVVDAGASFVEDTWQRLRIGGVSFRNVKPCDRCVVTTLDPETGAGGKEPLSTLAEMRARDGAVWFGVNLVPDDLGSVSVGDGVDVLATQPPWISGGEEAS